VPTKLPRGREGRNSTNILEHAQCRAWRFIGSPAGARARFFGTLCGKDGSACLFKAKSSRFSQGVVVTTAIWGSDAFLGYLTQGPRRRRGEIQLTGGRRHAPHSFSSTPATASTCSSSHGLPTICTPIGSPSGELPTGTTRAGLPNRLKNSV
jgi:hypothetical protein